MTTIRWWSSASALTPSSTPAPNTPRRAPSRWRWLSTRRGTLLFVVDTYQPSYTDLNPGPGALIVYPINSNGSLGTPVPQTVGSSQLSYYPLDNAPTWVNALANGTAVYVTETLSSAQSGLCHGASGGLVTLAVGSGGALSPVTGSPFCAGVSPSSVVSDPTNRFVYVTDSSQNQLIGFNILSGTNASAPNALQPFVGGPIAAGTAPSNITIDPRGLYMYVTNFYGNSVQGYSINTTTGHPLRRHAEQLRGRRASAMRYRRAGARSLCLRDRLC